MHTQVGFVRLVSTQLVLRRPSSQAKVEQTSTPNSEIATATREASMSGKMRIAPAFKLKSICRYPIFGPAPILDSEDSEAYEFLVARLYADLKPADIVEEGYLQDIAYWTWEIRRWRRMKVCLIETERVRASIWVHSVPLHQRLAYIGETDKIDIQEIKHPPMSAADTEKLKAVAAEGEKMLAEELSEEDRNIFLSTNLYWRRIPLRREQSWKNLI